ncbi:glycosyltransferase N-terminal domain-containing protein [Pseudomonas aeruginosa]
MVARAPGAGLCQRIGERFPFLAPRCRPAARVRTPSRWARGISPPRRWCGLHWSPPSAGAGHRHLTDPDRLGSPPLLTSRSGTATCSTTASLGGGASSTQSRPAPGGDHGNRAGGPVPSSLAPCAGIPVALANARLSERSARGYARFAGLTRPMLAELSWIAMQTEAEAERLRRLGASTECVQRDRLRSSSTCASTPQAHWRYRPARGMGRDGATAVDRHASFRCRRGRDQSWQPTGACGSASRRVADPWCRAIRERFAGVHELCRRRENASPRSRAPAASRDGTRDPGAARRSWASALFLYALQPTSLSSAAAWCPAAGTTCWSRRPWASERCFFGPTCSTSSRRIARAWRDARTGCSGDGCRRAVDNSLPA